MANVIIRSWKAISLYNETTGMNESAGRCFRCYAALLINLVVGSTLSVHSLQSLLDFFIVESAWRFEWYA